MKLPRPEMVLLDVDGTLVDSVPDLAYCIDAMMKALGLPRRGEDKVRLWVGNGVERLVKRALVDDLEGEPDPDLFQRALPIFLDCYQANICKRSRLFPGVREGLAWLKREGFKLGCVTNKSERFTLPLLEALGIRDYFQVVVCGDTLDRQKPDPAPLLHAARTLGVAPERSLLVGDSVSDVRAARAAGFQVVCVSYGYNHGEDIRKAGCDAVIDRLTELPELIGAPAKAAC
ncbi:MAG: phosphoglycolate phosphatase [Gammaproteobacteria bacterium]|nr:MAG: phosphoglycolate phosphatase [Gammaproteobacteria bacterium]